ncbi:type II toxin-antitoxin system VapC family toxin [Rhodococcus sp. IEGM 1401]|uniref:type II toxin-antitoxin system VapC family toxin n=1 Tax=unclassified Rhodococcus (in: high G+C Gram-positive bacteria) TaxID=192944 RepID=UPI0022B378B2|nr:MULTISPECIES: type II toxin-antitoxin system VapC family toxin [unclassified Rhodococcus (in: high G+C Gram-positive bacteria)]MCZ4561923.1 type II toxin-antitoxin system VapC family toxin [Rhodococcus sp. IEGM 1401]MDI9922697.1 type II toxin-antitoxin system VapC family toxin [Rhodococcus sp. IEGM 1372]MDV8034558.1 type II toxin-antitoxin system VapC family toxin [Rhodococcus sp. IEGM 1414]
MIYLDSSAVLKLIFDEAESDVLQTWLTERAGVPWVSSELAKIEVVRATRRYSPGSVSTARAVVAQMNLVPIDSSATDLASEVGDPMLRTLDAIHLASALLVRDHLTAFVAYDIRLAAAAEAHGLTLDAPG